MQPVILHAAVELLPHLRLPGHLALLVQVFLQVVDDSVLLNLVVLKTGAVPASGARHGVQQGTCASGGGRGGAAPSPLIHPLSNCSQLLCMFGAPLALTPAHTCGSAPSDPAAGIFAYHNPLLCPSCPPLSYPHLRKRTFSSCTWRLLCTKRAPPAYPSPAAPAEASLLFLQLRLRPVCCRPRLVPLPLHHRQLLFRLHQLHSGGGREGRLLKVVISGTTDA